MFFNQTLEKLNGLKLYAMVTAIKNQQKQTDINELSFEDRLGFIVDAECSERETRKIERLLSKAKLEFPKACLEDVDYDKSRKLDKAVINSLGIGNWVENNQHIIIEGASGTGKTWLACALANQMCRLGRSARFYRVTRLIEDIALARGRGTIQQFRNQLQKFEILILDDWLFAPLDVVSARELAEIITDRNNNRSLILTAQHPISDWHARIKEPTAADAVMDRIVHSAHTILIEGESMRKRRSTLKKAL